MAWAGILRQACAELGADDPAARQAAWLAERAETVTALRELCREYGDNDWPDTLHLVDVIDKHLARHLGC